MMNKALLFFCLVLLLTLHVKAQTIPLILGITSVPIISTPGYSQYFSITVPVNEELKIAAASSTSPTPAAIYASRNNPPSQTNYDASTTSYLSWDPTELYLNIPPSSFDTMQTQTWYILVFGSNSGSSPSTYTVTATTKSVSYSSLNGYAKTVSSTIGSIEYFSYTLPSNQIMSLTVNDVGSSKIYLKTNLPASNYQNDYNYDTAYTNVMNLQNNNPYSIVYYISVMPYSATVNFVDSYTISAENPTAGASVIGAIIGIVIAIVACCCCFYIIVAVVVALLFCMVGRFSKKPVVVVATSNQPEQVLVSTPVQPNYYP